MTLDSRQVAWFETHLFRERLAEGVGERPAAGTPRWLSLSDDDPRKVAALLDAGVLWCLDVDTAQEQRADAAKAVCQSVKELDAPTTWSAIAKEAHGIETFYANSPWLKRRTA